MSARVLQQLTSDDFAVSAGCLSTPGSLRSFLHRSKEVAALKEALRQEAITDGTLRRFVSSLLRDLRCGERFPHQLAIAAIAVILETRTTSFADEFLHDLSRLRLAEMSMCIRVARECLKHRVNMAQNKTKVLHLPDDGLSPARSPSPPQISFKCNAGQTSVSRVCEVA
jgi:hypothetical protein